MNLTVNCKKKCKHKQRQRKKRLRSGLHLSPFLVIISAAFRIWTARRGSEASQADSRNSNTEGRGHPAQTFSDTFRPINEQKPTWFRVGEGFVFPSEEDRLRRCLMCNDSPEQQTNNCWTNSLGFTMGWGSAQSDVDHLQHIAHNWLLIGWADISILWPVEVRAGQKGAVSYMGFHLWCPIQSEFQ